MQNRYAGDIGDFGKYALLKALAGENLRLGVVWYLNTSEEDNRDGSRVNYEHLRHCDPWLHDALAELRRSNRSVHTVKAAGLLPVNAVYYSEPICSLEEGKRPLPMVRARSRAAWHRSALDAVSEADLVFVDPDNGIAVKNVRASDRHSVKYVFLEEITDYVSRGQSVVIYHHQTREKGGIRVQVDQRLRLLLQMSSAAEAWTLIFRRQSVRAFIVVCCPKHVQQLRNRSLAFQNTVWCRDNHFELYAPILEHAPQDC